VLPLTAARPATSRNAGQGSHPALETGRGGRCSPSHIIHRMHVYCPQGKGFAYGLHLRATPCAGGSDRPHLESCCCRNRGKRSAKRQQSGGLQASHARKVRCGQPAGPSDPLHARKGSCNTRSRRCLRCRLAMGCLAAGESPDPRFHRSAFSVGMDPRGSRALAHTPGRPDPSVGTILQVPSPCPCGCCSTRRPDAGGP
jgi:hypothetical protein